MNFELEVDRVTSFAMTDIIESHCNDFIISINLHSKFFM